MANTFFSSDFHAYHTNMCRGTSSWDSGYRDFNNPEEMTRIIINSINSTVGKNDTLYNMGDFSFGGLLNIWRFRKQIVCENLINVCGNHDYHILKDQFIPNLEKSYNTIYEISDESKHRVFNSEKTNGDVTTKDLFKEVYNGTGDKGILIEINGQKIILNHYPLNTWEGIEDGVWLLHGHEHSKSKDQEKGKILDLDWYRFMRPISFDEVKEIMDTRIISPRGISRSH